MQNETGLSVGEWVTLASVLIAAGGALARLASQGARLAKLERGAEDQGRRIGDNKSESDKAIGEVKGELAALKEGLSVERSYQRRLTGAHKADE